MSNRTDLCRVQTTNLPLLDSRTAIKSLLDLRKMDRNLPGKSSYRSASSSSSRSSTSYSNRRYGAKPTRYSGQNPARTHDHRSRSVSEGDREIRTDSPIGQLEGEDEVKDCFDAQSLVGTCPFMCPEKERNQREQLRDLAVFERLDGNPRRTSSSLAVKKFCRTISTKDVQASDLRPLPVLEDTLNYLMKLLDSSDHPFEVVHDFIFDRTRSIRQDLSMQNIFSDRVIWMYEKMVKFHVISHYKLRRCKGDRSVISSIHHLNKEQLTKCLASLYNLYEVNRSSESIYANEAEFRSLYILLHLDSHTQLMGESLPLWFSRLPPPIIKSKEMNFARRVLRFFRMGNYMHFLGTIASEATYLQSYLVEPFISEVRAYAVACINSSGYKLHPYPLAYLSKILRMKESDLEYLCNACGLETSEDDMGNKFLPTKQTGFCYPKGGFEYHEFSLLELSEKDPEVERRE